MTTLHDREAAFTARIAADATHEMRNVLAIVKESAGLIADILNARVDGTPVDREKIDRAIGRIDTQVGRGAELMTHLNRFAHSLERRREALDLGREIEQAAFLGRRLAGKRRVALSPEGSAGAPGLSSDSFRVQMAIFAALEWWLARTPEGATLRLRGVDAAGRPAVEMTGDAGDGALPSPLVGSPEWNELLGLLDALGATVVTTDGGRGIQVVLSGRTEP